MPQRLPAAHVVAQLAVLRVAGAGDDGDRQPAAAAAAEPLVMGHERRQQVVAVAAIVVEEGLGVRRGHGARRRHRAHERGGDGVGVALHRRDGAVDLEGAGAAAGVDEKIDAHGGELLRLAPGGAERLGLERGEGAEQPLLEWRPRRILHEVDGELGQRPRDEVCLRRHLAQARPIDGHRCQDGRDRHLLRVGCDHEGAIVAGAGRVVARQLGLLLRGQRAPQCLESLPRAHASTRRIQHFKYSVSGTPRSGG